MTVSPRQLSHKFETHIVDLGASGQSVHEGVFIPLCAVPLLIDPTATIDRYLLETTTSILRPYVSAMPMAVIQSEGVPMVPAVELGKTKKPSEGPCRSPMANGIGVNRSKEKRFRHFVRRAISQMMRPCRIHCRQTCTALFSAGLRDYEPKVAGTVGGMLRIDFRGLRDEKEKPTYDGRFLIPSLGSVLGD